MIKKLRHYLYKHLGYQYDTGKHMWYRIRSECCDATTTPKAIGKNKDKYREFCDQCASMCRLKWSFKNA